MDRGTVRAQRSEGFILSIGYGADASQPTEHRQASLFPPISEARSLGRLIAEAVGKQAIQDGQAQIGDEAAALNRELEANIWEPA